MERKEVTVGGNDISKEYTYEYTRLSRVLHSIGETQIHNYMFGYDSLSRITSETDSKVSDYNNTYVYDVYGQLIRENNKRLNKTILYTYDNIGNITRVQKYDYTTDEEVSGTYIEDIYTYDSTYPDCLKTFNGRQITYDANGRVATYDGWTYTWERDKLKSIERINSTDDVPPKYTFTYNAYGERLSKVYTNVKSLTDQSNYLTNSTTTYKYDLCGRLIRENRSIQYSKTASVTKELTYLYDNLEIVGLIYTDANGTNTYYYDKNIFGDVIAILDNTGNPVVKYKYDAYGNCTVYDSVTTDLAETNPIRYRSYYYDVETQLYYLQTRYYNPEWRRFISPDNTSYLEPETPTGLNLYCYCYNNPIMYADPSGHSPTAWWEWALAGVAVVGLAVGSVLTGGLLAGALMGAAIGGAISIGTQAISGEGLSWTQFALDTGVGALTGMIGASSLSRSIATGLGTLIGGSSNFASQLISGTSIDEIRWGQVFVSAAVGGIASFAGGAGARNTNALNGDEAVSKAMNSVNKVLGRMNTNYYSSARYAQSALTNVSNRLGKAVVNAQLKIFFSAMGYYAVSTALTNAIIMGVW